MMPKRLSFSLRTLLFFVLMVGAGGALYLRWEPWQVVLTLRSGGTAVKQASFSPDGTYIATHSSQDWMAERSMTVVWDRAGNELFRTDWCYNMGGSGYDGVGFVSGGRYLGLYAAHHRSWSQLLDMRTFKTLFPDERGAACYPSLSRDEKRCAVHFQDMYGDNARFAVYDLEKGEPIFEEREFFEAKKDLRAVSGIRLSPDGRWVAAACDEEIPGKHIDMYLMVCDLETKTKHLVPTEYCRDIYFTADQKRLVAIGHSAVVVFDLPEMKCVFERSKLDDVDVDTSPYAAGLKWLMLRDGAATTIVNLLEPALNETKLEGAVGKGGSLSGDWLACATKGIITLRHLQTGEEYSVEAAPPDHDLYWNLRSRDDSGLLLSGNFSPLHFDLSTRTFGPPPVPFLNSPDGSRRFLYEEGCGVIVAPPETEPRARIPAKDNLPYLADWATDGKALLKTHGDVAQLWSRVRSDEPGALLWEPALWLTILFAGGFVYSFGRGYRARGA